MDGYDEISLTGNVKIITRNEENIFSPQDFSLQKLNPKSIYGGKTIKESAKIFMNILQNRGSNSQNQVVFANSGLAISTALNISIKEGIEKAKESLKTNKAFEAFNKLKNLSE